MKMLSFWLAIAGLSLCHGFVIQKVEPSKHVQLHAAPIPATPIPVMYVVDNTKDGGCKTDKTAGFVAMMCDANRKLYDGHVVTIALNTPDKEWDAYYGNVLYSNASASGLRRGENGDINDEYTWNNSYSFKYNQTYGDIYIMVTTGSCTGTLSYGVTLTFGDKKDSFVAISDSKPADYIIPRSSEISMQVMEVLHGINYEPLDQIYRLRGGGTVHTGECKEYSMSYCFGTGQHYNVTVATVAADEISGFGTFLCPHSYIKHDHCPQQTPYKDNNGGPFNIVTTQDISEKDKAGPVVARICGNGRYQEVNAFTLSSNGPRMMR